MKITPTVSGRLGLGTQAGGDLGGGLPSPTVTGIQGVPVCVTLPVTGEVLTFDGSEWCPAAPTGGTGFVLTTDGGEEDITAHGSTGSTETFFAAGEGNVHTATLNANCTFTFAAVTSGKACSFTIILTQDGTGSRLVTWPGSVVWAGGSAPTLSTTAAAVDVLTFFTLDGGTTWYGFSTGGSGSALTIEDEGTPLATAATELDFVGAGVTASGTGATKTITIPGGGGGGELLISSTPSTPLVFADILQNSAQDDFVYSS